MIVCHASPITTCLVVKDIAVVSGIRLKKVQDECKNVPQPKTKEELVLTAKSCGIEWDIDELLDLGESAII